MLVFILIFTVTNVFGSDKDTNPKPINKPKTILAEQSKITKAIVKMYKHISYKEASQVVAITYRFAKQLDIKPTLALAIIASESSFKKASVSNHGAIGYTQVIAKYHKDKIKGRNLYDPNVNIQVGLTIFNDCVKKHKLISKALGCYNGATTKEELERYVTKVLDKKKQITLLAMN